MARNQRPQSRPVANRADDAPVDFDAGQRLRDLVNSRPIEQGITIDPAGTRIIDDGLWIRPLNTGWVLKTHIADVPAMIPDNNILEQVARMRKAEKDLGKHDILRMFPGSFLDRYVSLHEGQARPAITFRIELDRNFSVRHYKISRTAFTSSHQCDYSPLRGQFNIKREDAHEWKNLANGLLFSRQKNLAHEGDVLASGNASSPASRHCNQHLDETFAQRLVHEAMLLTNMVALDFFKKNNVKAPTKIRGVYIEPTSISPDFAFDLACNKLCWNVLHHLDSQKNDYVRLTSPMRNFRDYATLKLLGNILSKKESSLRMQDDVANFTEKFNANASHQSEMMISGNWRNAWKRQMDHGGLTAKETYKNALNAGFHTATAALANFCHQQNLLKPMIAERELMLQGTRLFFAGMNFHGPKDMGRDKQVWAISHDREMALEMAAHRMLLLLSPQTPSAAPKITPV